MRFFSRIRASLRLGLKMSLHDKPKFFGTLLGAVFAVILATQQLSILFGLLEKNTLLVDNAGADIWIAPPGTETLQAGTTIDDAWLYRARTTDGVENAVPLILGTVTIKALDGSSEPMSLVGIPINASNGVCMGCPWNLLEGTVGDLTMPDSIVVEDSQREKFGDVNLGSLREVNGKRLRVAGLTWGLQAFAPPYAFTDFRLARELVNMPEERSNFVLVRAKRGQDLQALRATLATRLPDATVLVSSDFSKQIVMSLLRDQLGLSFGIAVSFGLIIGFVIVALSMFSSVLDNLREFGTLKAIGCSNWDLTVLIVGQSIFYALLGSLVGLGLAVGMVEGIRSAELAPVLPKEVYAITPVVMLVLCVLASLLALRRVRKLEPGMVFR